MSEWIENTLGNYIYVINGFAFKSVDFNNDRIENSLPVIKIKNVANGDVNLTGVQYYRYSDSLSKYIVSQGDILVALTGNHPQAKSQIVGATSRYKFEERSLLNQRVANIKPNADLNKDFLYYFLKDESTYNYLSNQSSGSANQANISNKDIENIPISLPPLSEQLAIASVLSSLDDKIDLLHRQNKTLEGMAEALFRKWFVEEADEGWDEKPLSAIANFVNGLACQKIPPKNDIDKLPVLKIRELSSGISNDCDWADSKVSAEYIIESGDVIFSWSASLMVKVWDGERCVLNQHLFKVTSDSYPKWIYLMWCKHHLEEFVAIAHTHATTMGHIKRGDLDKAMVLIPFDDTIKKMTAIIAPILEKQISNAKQIRILVKQRDALLPKLMSGEVRVFS